MFKAEIVAEKLIEVIGQFDKPVAIALLGSTLIEEARSAFDRSNIPNYPFPEKAASALGALFRRAEFLAAHEEPVFQRVTSTASRIEIKNLEDLLASYGIPTAPMRHAHDVAETMTFADEFGYPVVMKVASPDIPHKSDVGGVILDIKDAESLQIAYTKMMEDVKTARPDASIEGVHIQRQVPAGQEVIIGMVRDPQFGPLMMFGSGGVEVEGLKDVAFALAPLSQAEARKMIRKTWAGRKLKGFRDIPPSDAASVIDVLIKLSRLALENESIEEIEINPLRVSANGCIAVDTMIVKNGCITVENIV
jgi:acetyltransferase